MTRDSRKLLMRLFPSSKIANIMRDPDTGTPGFVNRLSWSVESLIAADRSRSEIRQGLTTEIFGEGRSMGPLNAEMKRRAAAGETDF